MPPEPSTKPFGRYQRQMLLPAIGQAGQAKLRDGTALVAGCGALGCMIAELLVRAGVGRLVIVDRDVVELGNLHRQVLFDEHDAEQALPKAVAAAAHLRAINGDVEVTPIVADITHHNIEGFAGVRAGDYPRADVILDGLDNFETRFLLNDLAVKHAVPYVYGGAVGTAGTAMAILPHSASPKVPLAERETPWERAGIASPDFRDLQEEPPPPGVAATCDTAGVLGPVVTLIASFQAAEAMKILLGDYEAVCKTLLQIDLWTNQSRHLALAGLFEASAGICSKQRRFEFLEGKRVSDSTVLCGRNAVQISQPGEGGEVDLPAIAERLRPLGEVKANRFTVRAELAEHDPTIELTIFRDGRAIVRGVTEPDRARAIYARYVGN